MTAIAWTNIVLLGMVAALQEVTPSVQPEGIRKRISWVVNVATVICTVVGFPLYPVKLAELCIGMGSALRWLRSLSYPH